MDRNEIIEKTKTFVKENMKGDSGHDWWHVERVYNNATAIQKKEGGDLFIIQLAALLHDIADWKFNDGDDSAGPAKAKEYMKSISIDEVTIDHVCNIIFNMSFKGAKVKSEMLTLEGKIVQDADRLDALGAIGIARCFNYGGYSGQKMHDPNKKIKIHESKEEYFKGDTTSINHFYEKLLLLKYMMNTETAKQIAEERHKFMEIFLEEFFKEWDGKE